MHYHFPTVKAQPEDSYPVSEDKCYLTYDGPFSALKSNKPYDYHVKEYRCYQPQFGGVYTQPIKFGQARPGWLIPPVFDPVTNTAPVPASLHVTTTTRM